MKRKYLILEQPDNSGNWTAVPPPLIGQIDKSKYDVSSDGKWYKPKITTPTPTPDPPDPTPDPNTSDIARIFWEKVKDEKLLEKLKAAGKKVWQEGGVWYRDIRDRLSNWWEDMTTLPDWAENQTCLNDAGGVNRSDSDDKVQVRTQDGEDYLYFYKSGKFIYENKVKDILNGTWKCVSGKLYIKTDDGYEFTKKDGWVKQGTSSLGSSSSSSTSSGKIYTTP